jgi:transcription elongation factor Elf1
VRELTGHDEAFWLDAPAQWNLPQRINGLLARCVVMDGLPGIGDAFIADLTVGDREALLLHLHRLSFGSRLSSVLTCPQCGERLDLELEAGDLLLPPYAHPQPWYDNEFQADEARYAVRYRLPTGADLDAIAPLAALEPAAAAEALIGRCVRQAIVDGETLSTLPAAFHTAFAAVVAQRDPQAELTIAMTCPLCGHEFSVLLDMATYLGQEIEQRAATLYREVHTLALFYHWSEADILTLPVSRRRMYLEMLDATVDNEQ